MEYIAIGRIVKAVGLKGEVKVYNYSGSKERYENLGYIRICDAPCEIEKIRYVKDTVILKLKGIESRDAAEAVKGEDIYIDGEELPELEEDEYYIRDLIGLDVVDDTGAPIGGLCDVIQNSAQDLYEVEMADGRKILIPAVEEFIINIDIENKLITVRLIEGLI